MVPIRGSEVSTANFEEEQKICDT